MLLQTAQRTTHPGRDAAFATLKAIAGKHHSLRMAALAAMIQTSTEGHFDMVVTEVDKMLAQLRQEEMDDITLRDYCQAENEDFKAALKDDIDAVALLASAIDAMTAFYKNNKLPLGLLAKKAHGKQPEYSVDPDAAPETFSAPYGGRSSEGGGITSIMGYIKEDLENEIKTSKAAEATAQKEFEEQKAAALKSLEALNAKKVTLEQLEADLDEKIAETGEEKLGKKTMKAQKKQYREEKLGKKTMKAQ